MTHSFPTRRSSDLVDQPDTDRAQKQIDRDRRANRTAQCLEKGSQQQGVAGTVESLLAEHIRELATFGEARSEEHTSELQSLMRISYAVFCLKKKKKQLYNNI